jgi:hypothetical protein
MNDTNKTERKYNDLRRQLLATASAFVLCGMVYADNAAYADDTDRPTVWIELGGQLERLQDRQDPYEAPFTLAHIDAKENLVPASETQRPPNYAFGGEGSIAFEPVDSDWIFSGDFRYGRSNGSRHKHQQTTTQFKQHGTNPFLHKYFHGTKTAILLNDTSAKYQESNLIADFTAGKDVGLGMFGRHSHAVFSVGVRYAQFHSQSAVVLRSLPDPYYPTNSKYNPSKRRHHSYYGHAVLSHGFSGFGPTLSMNASLPFLGNANAGDVAFDWGANAALLFGRQKVKGRHEETGQFFMGTGASPTFGQPSGGFIPVSRYDHVKPIARSHFVTVPNLGGFAGLTFQRGSAKVSFGYRADFFFGAMDIGVDTRKTAMTGFYGPFASVSVGLGG